MERILRYAWPGLLAGLIYLVWTQADRLTPGSAPKPKPAAYSDPYNLGGPVKILQFYAMPNELTEGQRATLCYGVSNAKAVSIDPPVERLSPSLNRCLPITPGEDTRYTLTAVGEDGRLVAESFIMRVKPDLATRPKIVYFTTARKVVDNGRTIQSLCFLAENVEEIRVDPPVIPPFHGPRGCFYVSPEQATTYTVTAIGRKGKEARRQLTLPGPEPSRPSAQGA